MKNIGVILAGNGFLDGAEIREAVLTLLSIDQQGAKATIFAPDFDQFHTINHLTNEEMKEKRNVLIESARIARGQIHPLEDINIDELDGLIIPGGFGVAKNLSTIAFDGAKAKVDKTFQQIMVSAFERKIPIGAICISPAVICLILKEASPSLTIGDDEATAGLINSLGGNHIQSEVTDVHVDEKNKIVSTPAYMFGDARLSKVATGIDKCVKEVIALINQGSGS